MGRSPFFAEHVKPIKNNREILQELDDIFCYFFAIGNVVCYEDNNVATIDDPHDKIYLRIIQSEHDPLPVLERSCSIYRKTGDDFPEKDSIYQIHSASKYKFKNKHSIGEPFYYNVLELRNVDCDLYATFCIKTDGAVLNIESMSLRGYISKVMVASSTEELRIGS